MATHDEHIIQAKHNEDVAVHLSVPECKSIAWFVIVAFYAALQYMEAALYNTSVKHSEFLANTAGRSPHLIREDLIMLDPRTKEIYIDYKELRKASEMFRYLKPGHNYFSEDAAKKLYDENLQNIKNHLQAKKLIKIA